MDSIFEKTYHTLEDSHWWFVSRRDLLLRYMATFPRMSEILEVGCSGGALMRELEKRGFSRVFGIDISEAGLDLCKKRDVFKAQMMDGTQLDFEDSVFDVVLASDVLEHIEHEQIALREWHRVLKTEGKLWVGVPAFSFLWSEHDQHNHHFRRYTRSQLVAAVEQAGFVVEKASYWNLILFFPIVVMRLIGQILPKVSKCDYQLHASSVGMNGFLKILLKIENVFLRWVSFPIGVSVFVIARKK